MDDNQPKSGGLRKISRALISTYDKTGLPDLVQLLNEYGVKIVSTGATALAIRQTGVPVQEVSELTGFPEILGGRVKSLHPGIHGGLLARHDNAAHFAELKKFGIAAFDLVVVNFYPFEIASARGFTDECCEEIDIGGPAMIRAAAKNYASVCVITGHDQYREIEIEMEANGGSTTQAFRFRKAAEAFTRSASYDAVISSRMWDRIAEFYPPQRTETMRLRQLLRYGENPHQSAAWYEIQGSTGAKDSPTQLLGKMPGFNNLIDTDAVINLVSEFDPPFGPACAIVKHCTPCGVAIGEDLVDSFLRAVECDPLSAFGGVIGFNRTLDRNTAAAISKRFVEVVVAPAVDDEALDAFSDKPGLRVFTFDRDVYSRRSLEFRQIRGGCLVQERDGRTATAATFETVTDRHPTPAEIEDLNFAWSVVKHAKSNAVVYARRQAILGIGAGETSRVDAANSAGRKLLRNAKSNGNAIDSDLSIVAASDGFLPFSDGLEEMAKIGVTAVVQPGGSRRDQEVIDAANELGISMIFTGTRHFKH